MTGLHSYVKWTLALVLLAEMSAADLVRELCSSELYRQTCAEVEAPATPDPPRPRGSVEDWIKVFCKEEPGLPDFPGLCDQWYNRNQPPPS